MDGIGPTGGHGSFSASYGMRKSAARMASAAAEFVAAAASDVRGDSVSAADDSFAVSAGAQSVTTTVGGFQELQLGDHGYRANLRSARASDTQFQQLLNMAIPQGYSRLVGDGKI